jgi:hypothetical protein
MDDLRAAAGAIGSGEAPNGPPPSSPSSDAARFATLMRSSL